jgi:type II restriction enzyme
VQNVIKICLRKKFQGYKPESNNMPFHFRLLGRDRMALFSFVHSLNTTFGTSIFEPVAVELAKFRFAKVAAQYIVGNAITKTAQGEYRRNNR